MNDYAVVSIAQIQELIKFSTKARFIRNNQTEAYQWINHTLGKFRYFRGSKKNRAVNQSPQGKPVVYGLDATQLFYLKTLGFQTFRSGNPGAEPRGIAGFNKINRAMVQ